MRLARSVFTIICLTLTGCDGSEPSRGAGWIDTGRLQNAAAEPQSWLTTGRDNGETRYSPLEQINNTNVTKLGLAWEYETFTQRGLEATPVVVDGVLYTTGNWGVVYALDAKTGQELWTFDPEVPGQWAGKACCDVVNRGVAVWRGRVYAASLDGRLFALDAASGKVIWQADTFIDRTRPYTITGAPRIANNVVVIGNGGADYGVRGYITAYDLNSGEQAWRFFTVPGDPSKPFEHPEMAMASKTWDPDSRWDIGGGGTAWDSMVWDLELNLLYVGTGNGGPWDRNVRSPSGGDNLFLASILAINPDTGRLVWHYQTTPGESWGYTATQQMILADIEIDGKTRKVLMQAPKNGFFYVLDRETGELLSAEKYAIVTWASHVDLSTGRPAISEDAYYTVGKPALVLPGDGGGHNWQPMSYHPGTGLVYFTYFDDPTTFSKAETFEYVDGWHNQAAIVMPAGFGEDLSNITPTTSTESSEASRNSFLVAWDPVKGQPAWKAPLSDGTFDGIVHGGVLSTAGNLVFQAKDDGNFTAYDAATGEVLHRIQTGNTIVAAPATYSIDGEQYVVVMAGWGGAVGGFYAPGAAVEKYVNDGRILAFKLGGGAVPLPPEREPPAAILELPALTASEETLKRGGTVFRKACHKCHRNLHGIYPDLRRMTPDKHEMFLEIVRGGLLQEGGMASFADSLSEEDAQAIHDYLIAAAIKARAAESSGHTAH
ncbi:MAG: PQQ-dependent dehydrogenase, methanol/ethanol family [Rhodospirillaceae bacterium]|jgi:quinohemoprotein ethanol dehydrogenase|nr:PQQ-dependent dehydrogenase, methanol/ethanol family [Rhodospirillaceae bacterium]